MSTEIVKTFDYEGSPVTFQTGDGLMANATQMAKRFGKTPKDWLRTEPAKQFINTLSSVRHICLTELVQVRQGGEAQKQGTWMHEDVAMEFARWLNPEFAIWCNDRIKELLTTGKTELQNEQLYTLSKALLIAKEQIETKDKQIAEQANTIALKTQVYEEQQCVIRTQAQEIDTKNEALNRQVAAIEIKDETINRQVEELGKQAEQIEKLKGEAQYTAEVLTSSTTYTLTEIAKDLDFTSVYAFTKWASEHGVLFRQSDRWMPTAKYSGKGYFSTRTYKFVRSDNSIGTSLNTVVTEKGRMLLHELCNKS